MRRQTQPQSLSASSTYKYHLARTVYFPSNYHAFYFDFFGIMWIHVLIVPSLVLGMVQQPLLNSRSTVTSTSTVTKTLTTTVANPMATTSNQNPAVQSWYAGQRLHGCDKTACASCRWWYQRQSWEPTWYGITTRDGDTID